MFCPRMHQEYLNKPIGNLGIAIDSPPIRAISTPYACVLTDRFYEFCLLPRNDRVFDCDQHRAFQQFSANLLWAGEGTPFPCTPWTNPCHDQKCKGTDCHVTVKSERRTSWAVCI